jgi:hypothetical protein
VAFTMTVSDTLAVLELDDISSEEACTPENTQLGIALGNFLAESASGDAQAAFAPYNAAL